MTLDRSAEIDELLRVTGDVRQREREKIEAANREWLATLVPDEERERKDVEKRLDPLRKDLDAATAALTAAREDVRAKEDRYRTAFSKVTAISAARDRKRAWLAGEMRARFPMIAGFIERMSNLYERERHLAPLVWTGNRKKNIINDRITIEVVESDKPWRDRRLAAIGTAIAGATALYEAPVVDIPGRLAELEAAIPAVGPAVAIVRNGKVVEDPLSDANVRASAADREPR